MKFNHLLVYLSMISILLTISIPSLTEPMNSNKNFIFSIVSFFSIFLYLLVFRSIYTSWIRFETLFLIGFIVVHFQIPFLFSINIHPSRPEYVWLNPQVVNYATWLSALSIHLWMIGSTIGCSLSNNDRKNNKTPKNTFNTKRLDYILLISFMGFFSLAGGALLKGSHDGMDSWGEGASYFMIVLRVSLYFRIYIFFKTLKKISLINIFRRNIIFLAVLTIYSLTFLLAGDRGPVMQIGIVIILCYGIFIKKITLVRLVFIIIFGSLLLSVIGLGRSVEDGNLFHAGFEKFQNTDANATEELATSVRIMYRALTYFPAKFDYLYGLQFLFGFLGMIPFLSGFVIDFFQIPSMLTTSSLLFTFVGQGNNATYGEGTEIISDIFINFGIIGVFTIMFLYGYVTSKISYNAIMKKSDKIFLILIVITSTAIYINRAQFLSPLKDILYITILFYIVKNKIPLKNKTTIST